MFPPEPDVLKPSMDPIWLSKDMATGSLYSLVPMFSAEHIGSWDLGHMVWDMVVYMQRAGERVSAWTRTATACDTGGLSISELGVILG